jgi:hypothetical protein
MNFTYYIKSNSSTTQPRAANANCATNDVKSTLHVEDEGQTVCSLSQHERRAEQHPTSHRQY